MNINYNTDIFTANSRRGWEGCTHSTNRSCSRCSGCKVYGLLQRVQCKNGSHRTRRTHPNSYHYTTRPHFHLRHKNTTNYLFPQKGCRLGERNSQTRPRHSGYSQPETYLRDRKDKGYRRTYEAHKPRSYRQKCCGHSKDSRNPDSSVSRGLGPC